MAGNQVKAQARASCEGDLRLQTEIMEMEIDEERGVSHVAARDAIKLLVREYLRREEFKPRVRGALHDAVTKRREETSARQEWSLEHGRMGTYDEDEGDNVTVMRRRTVAEAVDVLRKQGFVDELTKLATAESTRTAMLKRRGGRPSSSSSSDSAPNIWGNGHGGSVMRVRVIGVDGLHTPNRNTKASVTNADSERAKLWVMWSGQRRCGGLHVAETDALGSRAAANTSETHFFDIPRACLKSNGCVHACKHSQTKLH